MPHLPVEEHDQRLREGHAALVAGGVFAPLGATAEETRGWMDCQIVSLVENRFLEVLDPRALNPEARAQWTGRALRDDERIDDPHEHAEHTSAYWLLSDARQAVGTIALSHRLLGTELVGVSNLYVLPEHRGQGIAGRALRRCYEVLRDHGAYGLRVPTQWSWQPAVRFYLRLGLWVDSWKHGLTFTWRADLPEYHVGVDRETARFEVRRDGVWELLIRAKHCGRRLDWEEEPGLPSTWVLSRAARATFAVGLAVRGWPLIRSEASWDQRRLWSDVGQPEGLAYKIAIFEAIDRRHGFVVRTPPIPGLHDRPLDEIA